MKLPVSAKLIGQSKGIVLHHIPHTAVQLVRSLGMEYRMPYRKAHIGNKIFRTASGKTYPDISPGLLFIRLVKGKLSRSYEETASGFQRIFLARDAENPFSAKHIMDHIMRLQAGPKLCSGSVLEQPQQLTTREPVCSFLNSSLYAFSINYAKIRSSRSFCTCTRLSLIESFWGHKASHLPHLMQFLAFSSSFSSFSHAPFTWSYVRYI